MLIAIDRHSTDGARESTDRTQLAAWIMAGKPYRWEPLPT